MEIKRQNHEGTGAKRKENFKLCKYRLDGLTFIVLVYFDVVNKLCKCQHKGIAVRTREKQNFTYFYYLLQQYLCHRLYE
jgi:hypothetical protein